MMVLATPQSQGIAKGFGIGMALVLLAYAGLYGWAGVNGPEAREQRDGKLVARTVTIERVLPINPPIEKPVATQEPLPPPDTHAQPAAETPVAEPAHETVAAEAVPTPPPASEQPAPAPVEAPPAEDATLKNIQKYANGMYISPVDGLYEDTPDGRLPVIRKDGLTPYKAYKKPFANPGNKPVISIAVMDMGLSTKITDTAIKTLPAEISLIVSPYAEGPDMWTNNARAGGHEVWLSLPMESSGYPKIDPGPHTLLVGAPERENLQKLNWIMSRAAGYTGLVATYQPEFMASTNDLRPVLGSLYKRGIAFLDSGNLAGAVPETMAVSLNAPYSNIDVWIDKPENTPQIINASLQQLEVIARENGFAAGIISPTAVSFTEVQTWAATLNDKGIILAPLSAQTGY